MTSRAPEPITNVATVMPLAVDVVKSGRGTVPCATLDSDLWFADDQVGIDRAQALCQRCPLQVDCLEGAIARREPFGVWGGELFHKGQVVAQRQPKGRPRKDADQIAAAAQQRLEERLAAQEEPGAA